jgi:hypothetical protein
MAAVFPVPALRPPALRLAKRKTESLMPCRPRIAVISPTIIPMNRGDVQAGMETYCLNAPTIDNPCRLALSALKPLELLYLPCGLLAPEGKPARM